MMSASLSQTYAQTTHRHIIDHTHTDTVPRDDVGVTLSDLRTDHTQTHCRPHTQTQYHEMMSASLSQTYAQTTHRHIVDHTHTHTVSVVVDRM